jgi:hypothetical protein
LVKSGDSPWRVIAAGEMAHAAGRMTASHLAGPGRLQVWSALWVGERVMTRRALAAGWIALGRVQGGVSAGWVGVMTTEDAGAQARLARFWAQAWPHVSGA